MAHEDLSRDQHVEGSSDRSFGLVFSAVFFLVGCWPLSYGQVPRWWAIGIAAAFSAIAVLKPALLAGFNRQWIKLGVLLGKIVSPLALGILFFAVIAPIGLLMRLTGKDPLRLKLESSAKSYWLPRMPPGPPPDSMTNQF